MNSKEMLAVEIMIELNDTSPDCMKTIRQIADRLKISRDYAEQIISRLRGFGMLFSRRGVNGGVWRTEVPYSKITLFDIRRCFDSCEESGSVLRRIMTRMENEAHLAISIESIMSAALGV